MENEHGPRALANDEVALPMAGLCSGIDSLGPFMDGNPIFDRISRRPRSARTAAFVTTREITPQLFGLLGGAVDEGVDRLAAHDPQTTFVSYFQPPRNLFGRPPFCEAVERGGRERRSARLGLSRSTLHAASAIDKLRQHEVASSARWAACCGTVRARSSTSDGGSPGRWRRSNGPKPLTNQSVLFRHLTNANRVAWQHSLRS